MVFSARNRSKKKDKLGPFLSSRCALKPEATLLVRRKLYNFFLPAFATKRQVPDERALGGG